MASTPAIRALVSYIRRTPSPSTSTTTIGNGYVVNIRSSPSDTDDNCCYVDGVSKSLTYDCYTRYENDPDRINFRTLAEYGVLPSNEEFFANAKSGDTLMITDKYKERYLMGVISTVTSDENDTNLYGFMTKVQPHLKPNFFKRYVIFRPHSMIEKSPTGNGNARSILYPSGKITDLIFTSKYVIDAVANLTNPNGITRFYREGVIGFYRNGWFTRNRPERLADTYDIHTDIMLVTDLLAQ